MNLQEIERECIKKPQRTSAPVFVPTDEQWKEISRRASEKSGFSGIAVGFRRSADHIVAMGEEYKAMAVELGLSDGCEE